MVSEGEFLALLDKVKWSDVDSLVTLAKESNFNFDLLMIGLKSSKKQAIEVLCSIFVDMNAESAIPYLFELLQQQCDTANAIRARNAIISFGPKSLPYCKVLLDNPKWVVRLYVVQIIALAKDIEYLKTLEIASLRDKSEKVKNAALQAIDYLLGANPLSECSLLPQPDSREYKIGMQKSFL